CRPSAAGEVTDYGDYSKATALSSIGAVTLDAGAVTIELSDEPFSYQGDLRSPELPWLVNAGYRLDGADVSAVELAGKSGALEIRIETSRNPAADRAYYDNYVMQITLTFDGDDCSNLRAPDASVANAGSDKTAAFTVLPGDDADVTVKADVTDFEMDGIQFAALPFSMAFDLPDAGEVTDDMDELTDAIGDLADGTAKLADGASELDGGVGEFEDGVSDVGDGAEKLAGGSSDFAKGLKELDKGSAGLVSGSAVIGGSLNSMSEAMAPLSGGLDLSGLFAMLPGFDETPTGAAVIAQVNALNKGLGEIHAGLGALAKNYSSFHGGLESYTGGVGTLSSNYGKLDESLSLLSGGLSEVSKGASTLSGGASELAKGADELADGASELADGVSDLPDKVQEKMDEFAKEYDKSDYEPRSFTSAKNREASLVQFVFRTGAIEKPEEAKPEEKTPEKTTFISRLLALFGVG
ncbi:MAG: hypothetical protein LBS67_04570, partial [Clostridiales Family XIII bacterium]|nr:hypothetical protein [Clostridiales Family XIII bacterium]